MTKMFAKNYMGCFIGIIRLFFLLGFIFLIAYGLDKEDLGFKARDFVLFLVGIMGLVGVYWSQEKFNDRQRQDHEHDWQRERAAKLLEKQEEALKLVLKVKSEVDTINIIANRKIGLERIKTEKKVKEIDSSDKESNDEINSSDKEMAEQFINEYKLLIDDIFTLKTLLELYSFLNKEEITEEFGKLISKIRVLKFHLININANFSNFTSKINELDTILIELQNVVENLKQHILNIPNDLLDFTPREKSA